MAGSLVIDARVVGRKKPLFADWSVPFPPELGDGGRITLRDLITRIVVAEVEAFRKRQDERRIARFLSAAQIEEAVEKGKVDMGGRNLKQKVDEGAAVGTALQAFEDGLYLVVLDGKEQRELDRQVFLRPESRVTFLRLVMLAGG